MPARSTINAAVIGLGYWGPNLARNVHLSPEFELTALCDSDPERLRRVAALYPQARLYTSTAALLEVEPPDLVIIATPVSSHHELAVQALRAGCHVIIEKPMAASTAEAGAILEEAERAGRRVFVDHTFIYTGAVQEIAERLRCGDLGELYYVDSTRINLGIFQSDVDVIWDLVPHDLSILQFVLNDRVAAVRVIGSTHNPRELTDVAYVHIEYTSGLAAHLHVSWLSPVKVRRMIFSGRVSSLIFDDINTSEKVKIYDHGVSFEEADPSVRRQVLVKYRRGEMRAPAVNDHEALATGLERVAAALRGEPVSVSTGIDGFEVVRVLEACDRSRAEGGARIAIEQTRGV